MNNEGVFQNSMQAGDDNLWIYFVCMALCDNKQYNWPASTFVIENGQWI